MSVDAAEKAILYFVELLMNSPTPLTISQLAGHFGSRTFTAEMRTAAGVNESGLRKLLLKYPSLFTVHGNLVRIYDGVNTTDESDENDGKAAEVGGIPDVSVEMDAVEYFRCKLARKGDSWMPIRSLAGHLSQAPADVRTVVGPQLEFGKWLRRHPYIFDVQDEQVRLQNDVLIGPYLSATSSTSSLTSRPSTLNDLPGVDSAGDVSEGTGGEDGSSNLNLTPKSSKPDNKLVTALKDLIKSKGHLELDNIPSELIMHAPVEYLETMSDANVSEIIRKHPGIFSIDEHNNVMLVRKSKSSTGRKMQNRSEGDDRVALLACSGTVYHLSKLWGIIDLGQHEHVFFDKSLLDRPDVDLRSEYRIGQVLYFDAISAPEKSRARWKAVRVWQENGAASQDNLVIGGRAKANRLPDEHSYDDESDGSNDELFVDSQASAADDLASPSLESIKLSISNLCLKGVLSPSILSPCQDAPEGSMNIDSCAESLPSTRVPVSSSVPASNIKNGISAESPSNGLAKCYADAACQTVSTGPIVSTQYVFDD